MEKGAEYMNNQEEAKYEHYQVGRNSVSKSGKQTGRKNSFGKVLAGTILLAAVFGLVSGLVFQAVSLVGEQLGESSGFKDETAETAMNKTTEQIRINEKGWEPAEGTVAGVARMAMPSVVAITSVSIQEISGFYGFGFRIEEYPSTGSGSGIIVGESQEELLIATNNHVVEGADTLSVCFTGEETEGVLESAFREEDLNVEGAVNAKIKGTDPVNDLAVIAVKIEDIPQETRSTIKVAQIGNSNNLMVGEQVVAIGNALGYGQSVTSGWISALDRTVYMENGSSSRLIQTDAAINPGNSGGALLNMRGELIGINSAKYADNTVEGMGYAIPISKAEPILQELMSRVTREIVDLERASYLGVEVADLSAEAIQMYHMPEGAFVVEVTRDEAAESAGIRKGDIIIQMDGQKITGKSDLIHLLQYYAAEEVVEIMIARSGNGGYKEEVLKVKLGLRPDMR